MPVVTFEIYFVLSQSDSGIQSHNFTYAATAPLLLSLLKILMKQISWNKFGQPHITLAKAPANGFSSKMSNDLHKSSKLHKIQAQLLEPLEQDALENDDWVSK